MAGGTGWNDFQVQSRLGQGALSCPPPHVVSLRLKRGVHGRQEHTPSLLSFSSPTYRALALSCFSPPDVPTDMYTCDNPGHSPSNRLTNSSATLEACCSDPSARCAPSRPKTYDDNYRRLKNILGARVAPMGGNIANLAVKFSGASVERSLALLRKYQVPCRAVPPVVCVLLSLAVSIGRVCALGW